MKFTLLKVIYFRGFSAYSQSCTTIATVLIPEHFYHPRKKPHTLSPLPAQKPLIYSVSKDLLVLGILYK